MKKLIVTLCLSVMCVGAYAQGKITFVNDSLHSYYYGTSVLAADQLVAGKATTGGTLAGSGKQLRADLYGGATADALTLQTTTTLSATPGRQSTSTFLSPTLPGGVMAYFQVQIRDVAFPTAAAARDAFSYYGFGEVFTLYPSSSTAGASIVNASSPFFSTWARGTYDLAGSGVPGYMGAVMISVVPEPTSMAIVGFGLASLLILRRRK